MISIREIADDNTSISSTRWAFASVIKFDFIIIAFTLIAFIVCHLVDKPLDESFMYGVVTLLGVLTALVGVPKVAQGFEPKDTSDTEVKNIKDGK